MSGFRILRECFHFKLCVLFVNTDHCSAFVIGRTWLNPDSYQNSARMDSKCTEVSSYGWKPNSRMKNDVIKARNMSPNLISKSSLRGLTNYD